MGVRFFSGVLLTVTIIMFCLLFSSCNEPDLNDNQNTNIQDMTTADEKKSDVSAEVNYGDSVKEALDSQKPATSAKEAPPLDQTKVFNDLKIKANNGDPEAQFNLGLIYETGNEQVPKGLGEAVRWYEKATNQGHILARNKMAVIYYNGLAGFQKDQLKAKEYFEKSIAEGSANAMFMLGRIYLDGADDIKSDLSEGTRLIKQAASRLRSGLPASTRRHSTRRAAH